MSNMILGLVLLCAGYAHAQAKRAGSAPEMRICSVPLVIGMTKAKFVDEVSADCEVIRSVVGDDSWLLKQKGPNGKPEGMVEFADGRIVEVRRSWTPSGGRYEPADFARSLVSAIEAGLQGSASATGVVSYAVRRAPDMTLYQMTLALPDHREVRVDLIENPAKPPSDRVIMLDVQEAIVK